MNWWAVEFDGHFWQGSDRRRGLNLDRISRIPSSCPLRAGNTLPEQLNNR